MFVNDLILVKQNLLHFKSFMEPWIPFWSEDPIMLRAAGSNTLFMPSNTITFLPYSKIFLVMCIMTDCTGEAASCDDSLAFRISLENAFFEYYKWCVSSSKIIYHGHHIFVPAQDRFIWSVFGIEFIVVQNNEILLLLSIPSFSFTKISI